MELGVIPRWFSAGAEKDGKWGFIDKSGKFVIGAQFDHPAAADYYGFPNGLCFVQRAGRLCYIDKTGKTKITLPRYSQCGSFHNGLAWITLSGSDNSIINPSSYLIDQNGKTVLSSTKGDGPHISGCFFDGLAPAEFTGDNVAPEMREEILKGYIDANGKTIIKPMFRNAYAFSEGLAECLSRTIYDK